MRCQDNHPDCNVCHGECNATATDLIREIGTPHTLDLCAACAADALDSGLYERPEALIDAIADAEIDDYLLRKHGHD